MSGRDQSSSNEAGPDDAGIEELLRQVGARDEPSNDVMQEVRSAVHSEWQAMIEERNRHRRTMAWGIAASTVFAIVTATFGLRLIQQEPMPIATVMHIDGHLLADAGHDEWSTRAVGRRIAVGETVQTDDRSRAAISFADGLSVRLDRNTTLRLASADRVVLGSGALYVDSPPAATGATLSDNALIVQAHAGSVRHIGTQYLVRTHADDIEVSVREGLVKITNVSGTSTGEAGQRIHVRVNGEVTRSTISPRDAHWQWVSSVAPPFDINEQSLASFLNWVARETGRKVLYASSQAETAAARVKLRGSIAGLDPDTALTAVLSTTQLRRYETKAEFIGITFAEPIDQASSTRPTL